MSMYSIEPVGSRLNFPTVNPKRIFDVTLTSLILLLLCPVLLLIACAVALTSKGPIFFFQTRVGHLGRPFKMIKFRSMYEDAEKRRADVAHMSERAGLCLKIKNDPRITPVGRFIRRWSLDELPQLFNVILGDMSLVGPRPALVVEVAEYPDHAHARHNVLPGISGLWQVSGRADLGFDEMIELDLRYVRQMCLLTDLVILFRTFGAVFGGKGAY